MTVKLTTAEFRPLTAGQRESLWRWIGDYIVAPHPDLGRKGAVCPFVEPSIRADSLVTVGREWPGGQQVQDMVDIIVESMDMFTSMSWKTRQPNLRALVVAMPDLRKEDWWLIDEGHKIAKDLAVARGLMIGQFHPECPAPAARNPFFPVNRAPMPLIALRNMAFHDILFLHDKPDWFVHYRKRYGKSFGPDARIDAHFRELYVNAERAADLEPRTA